VEVVVIVVGVVVVEVVEEGWSIVSLVVAGRWGDLSVFGVAAVKEIE